MGSENKIRKLKFFKPLLWKAYFDKGFGITNYVKYIIAGVGFAGLKPMHVVLLACVYLPSCILIGREWYRHHLTETEFEIQNMFNPFTKEVRSKLSRGKDLNNRGTKIQRGKRTNQSSSLR